MSQLFKRSLTLSVSKAGERFFGSRQYDVTEISDLRVEFSVQQSLGREPNTCEATITNLADGSRAAFQEKPLAATLRAGYGEELATLFSGDVRHCHSLLEGSDWRTTLTIADGDRAYMHANISRTWARGTPIGAVVRDMAAAMDLSPPPVSDNRRLRGSYSADGRVSREMTLFLSGYDMTWSIQEGRLQVLAKDRGNTAEAVLVNQDTGMIGSPEFGAPERPRAKPVLRCMSLLNPLIYPGRHARIESSAVTGLFIVHEVEHKGDTHGSDWSTEFEAVAA